MCACVGRSGGAGLSNSAGVEARRPVEVTPGPGQHDVAASLSKRYWSIQDAGATAFKSNTVRFKDESLAMAPGPMSYTIPSTIKAEKPKKYRKTHLDVDVAALNPSAIPSIPARHQSYGYEAGSEGKLVLQDPVVPGYTGLKNDRVGPGDYDPKIVTTKKGVIMSGVSIF
jgi:hypothetical protein